MSLNMRRQRGFLRRRKLARPVTASPTGDQFAGAPPPDQRLVDVRHANPEQLSRRPRRKAAINRRQNSRPQILRIALPLPPNHRCPPQLVVQPENHTSSRAGIPRQRFHSIRQCSSDVQVPAEVALTLLGSGTLSDSDFIGYQTYKLADG